MYCQKCGTKNPDNAQVCSSCSSPLITAPAQTPALSPKTSNMATASLILAILSPFTCLMTAIPAIILGIISLVKIQKSSGQLKGSGLAIAGIVIGPASLPVVALLLGILMPALARVRQISFRMVCGTNMVALGKTMIIYASDYDEKYPTPSKWCDLLIEYDAGLSHKIFRCKGAPEGPCNYALNTNIEKLGKFSPPDMVLLFETYPDWNQSGGPEILTTDNHQDDGCNVLFVDCHAEFVRKKDLKNLRWTPD